MTNFHGATVRAAFVGISISLPLTLSGLYFGLQTGWLSGASMPSALLGFCIFSAAAPYLSSPLTVEENVFLLTLAGAAGAVPLSAGYIAVIPSIQYLTTPSERGSTSFTWASLLLRSFGACYFGPLMALLLRRFFIVQRPLQFPDGTAVAATLGVLFERREELDRYRNLPIQTSGSNPQDMVSIQLPQRSDRDGQSVNRFRVLMGWFVISGLYTLSTYFVPAIRHIPIFGSTSAHKYSWTFTPSPGYVSQGVFMGTSTSLHMLLGAVVGWAILVPLATSKGWIIEKKDDFKSSSKGWVIWIGLAVLLADAVVSFVSILISLLISVRSEEPAEVRSLPSPTISVDSTTPLLRGGTSLPQRMDNESPATLHDSMVVERSLWKIAKSFSYRTWSSLGIVASTTVCILSTNFTFNFPAPTYEIIMMVLVSSVLCIMALRAAGETNATPTSGIEEAKFAQALFGVLPIHTKANPVLVSLIAGALVEATANASQDLMHNFKTGHLLSVPPDTQLLASAIGTAVGIFVSTSGYKLYSTYYPIPGSLFESPTAIIWIQASRLFTGENITVPKGVLAFALAAIGCFLVIGIVRALNTQNLRVQCYLPSGVAFSIGIIIGPSFVLPRVLGGILLWYWCHVRHQSEVTLKLAGTGAIVGEGLFSLLNILFSLLSLPHL